MNLKKNVLKLISLYNSLVVWAISDSNTKNFLKIYEEQNNYLKLGMTQNLLPTHTHQLCERLCYRYPDRPPASLTQALTTVRLRKTHSYRHSLHISQLIPTICFSCFQKYVLKHMNVTVRD